MTRTLAHVVQLVERVVLLEGLPGPESKSEDFDEMLDRQAPDEQGLRTGSRA